MERRTPGRLTMNQYRCETCKKKHHYADMGYHSQVLICEGEELPINCETFTESKGCASHSDFQSERLSSVEVMGEIEQARQQERDKVLEVIQEINRTSLTGFTTYTYRRWILEKLRQAGEP
jgi:hypothetical protein